MTPRARRLAFGLLFAGAFALYVSTASRTIGWWDDSHYSLLAATLSITNPPGSLLLTVLGWLWTRVIWCPPFAFQLHVLAAAMGAATVAITAWSTLRAVTPPTGPTATRLVAGLAAGAWLLPAFHFWTYATQFTPYGITALFTAMLLLAFLRWWQRSGTTDAVAELALLAFIFGLDFSVHRTNQLLLPGLVAGVALQRPGAFIHPRTVAAAVLAYAAGVSTQAGYLVLSARHPLIDMADAHSLAELYRFVRMDPIGGGFLINLWPRRADFLHVQLADWGRFLWTNLGAVPATRWAALVLAVTGAIALARQSCRLACALLALFLCAGLGAVIYFNRPVSYMRPLDRHYLASLVLLAPFVGAGLGALIRALLTKAFVRLRWVPAVLMLAVVCWNVAANHAGCDRSHTRHAETFARDLLEPLPPDAILFTNGDNDSFPLYFLQQVEHVRADVLVVNLPMFLLPSRQRRIQQADSSFAHVRFGEHPEADLIQGNGWRRPVYVAVTVVTDPWPGLKTEPGLEAQPVMALEGLSSRMLPPGSPAPSDSALVRFVHERLPRAGLRDRRQILEPEVEGPLANYAYAGTQLVREQMGRGDTHGAYLTLQLLERELRGAHLGASADSMEKFIGNGLAGLRERARSLGIEP